MINRSIRESVFVFLTWPSDGKAEKTLDKEVDSKDNKCNSIGGS